MNVVSTTPSATEILYELGVEPAAVSHACDHPPDARQKPTVDVSRITGESSAERHQQVADASADGGVHDVHADRLRNAEPDLIVTQEVCGVCAVDERLVGDVLDDIDADPDVLALDASDLDDVFECIRRVGAAVDASDRADALVADLRERIRGVERTAARAERRPSVALFEWMDPPRPAGNWVPELVELAGGRDALAEAGERSAQVDWATVRDAEPDVVIAAPCGYDETLTRRRFGELADREGWHELPAAETGRTYAMDGGSYFNRWTPRLVDALDRLVRILHPDLFGDPPADVLAVRPDASG